MSDPFVMYRFSIYFRLLKFPSIKVKEECGCRGLYINIPFFEIIIGLNPQDYGFELFRLIRYPW
jgi:hypothetical protein